MNTFLACKRWFVLSLMGLCFTAAVGWAGAADLITDGRANGAIWRLESDPLLLAAEAAPTGDAAGDLALYLERISGVRPEMRIVPKGGRPPADEPAMVVGQLALDLGLKPPPKTPSRDGYSIQSKGSHLLLAGESLMATRYAATHYLESLGCNKVFLNGQLVGEFTGSRRPADVEVTGKLLAGRDNLVAIKTGHMGISELMLGGLLRPAMIYAGPRPEPPPANAKK